MAWTDLTAWRKVYRDAPTDDTVAQDCLDAAQEVCEAFAPRLAEGDPVPARYRKAVQQQARELWQASRRESADTIGADGYVIRVRPLTGQVRQLLRPPRAVGYVG